MLDSSKMAGPAARSTAEDAAASGATPVTSERGTGLRGDSNGAARNEHELALLRGIAAREVAAMTELYHLYHRRLARFLMRLTSRYELAEEIINDTFWVVWQRAGDFRGASRVSTWILGIAYRRALKTLQRQRPVVSSDEVAEEPADEPWQRAELREWLGVALERLPLEQRMVLELSYHVGHSCEEIAQIMQCPVNTVKTRMFHGRRKLKSLLVALAGSG